jgi:SAM-dependent methyltransferase
LSKTITDYGRQWSLFPENEGYYASDAMFADICSPLLSPSSIKGLYVAELGSGSGRIVQMLLNAGAAHVTAVEPSEAMRVLKQNTAADAARITYINDAAEHLPPSNYDLIVSIGVIHHIPKPAPVMTAAFNALKPNGRMLIWVYGLEGNELYLALVRPLRAITKRLPDFLLFGLSQVMAVFLSAYIWLCRRLPLPMRDYMVSVLGPYAWPQRVLTIFDQLNPTHARYYRREEAEALMSAAGFVDLEVFNRHGYSWTVFGRKPAGQGGAQLAIHEVLAESDAPSAAQIHDPSDLTHL